MNNPINKPGIRHDMPSNIKPEQARTELENLVTFMATVKNTARIRAKTEDKNNLLPVNFLHTRTGTIFGQIIKAITSRNAEAIRQRELARNLILEVVNNLELNGDKNANEINESIRKELGDANKEFNKVALQKGLIDLLDRLKKIDAQKKQTENLITDNFNDNDADNYAPVTLKKDVEKIPDHDQQPEEDAPLLNALKNAEKLDLQDLPDVTSSFETKESIKNSLTRSIESASQNEEANNLMAEIPVSEDMGKIHLSIENNSHAINKINDENLELVSLDANMTTDPNGFHKIDKPFSITHFQNIHSIHADVYLIPKKIPLNFNEEKLISEKNFSEGKYEIEHGTQDLSNGKRNYIKLKLDNSITPRGNTPSALDSESKAQYQSDLVSLYKSSVNAVIALSREEGKNPIKTIAINPITFTNNVASDVEIQALVIALRDIKKGNPDLFICIVTTGHLQIKIVDAMKQSDQLPV